MADADPDAGTLTHWNMQGEGTTGQTLALPKLWLGLAIPLAFALETAAFFLYAAL